MMAFTCIAGALHGFAGQRLSGDSRKDMRKAAAADARWLRDTCTMRPFSFRWCCHVLSVEPAYIRRHGLARIPGITLCNWRHVRAHRDDCHATIMKRSLLRCAYCNQEFLPNSNHGQRFCSQRCNGRAQSARSLARRAAEAALGTTASGVTSRYMLYCIFCERVGVPAATEAWWRALTG
jgi:hypothetical protein